MVRPANVVTSIADVVAGVAIAGRFESGLDKTWVHILFLCLSTAFLYAGGIVYNDVFDADLDAIERPERAIPSGAITLRQAKAFGFILLVLGITLAAVGSPSGGFIALGIAFFALLYDKWGKHNFILGPLNMGICRGLNLMLGVSMVPFELQHWYLLSLVPIVYIYAVTLISRGEVHGGNSQNLRIGAVLYATVIGAILYLANENGELEVAGVLLILFALMIFIPLNKAIQYPSGANVGKAVKAGVLALIVMDAAWAVTFDSWIAAVIIACLLPISIRLGKFFAVT